MLNKQPDQQLHDEIIKRAEALGVSAFPFLPNEGTPYPFIVVDYTNTLPIGVKSRLIGEVSAQVSVWGDKTDRQKISSLIASLYGSLGAIRKLEGTTWSMSPSSSYEIIKDNSTSEMLYHGILDLKFKFM